MARSCVPVVQGRQTEADQGVTRLLRRPMPDYEALVTELRRRRMHLGLSQEDVNAAMGMADGYIAKLESFARTTTFPTLLLWVETLGLQLTTAPNVLPRATMAALDRRASAPYQINQARWKHAI